MFLTHYMMPSHQVCCFNGPWTRCGVPFFARAKEKSYIQTDVTYTLYMHGTKLNTIIVEYSVCTLYL
jgi:hypothetical protein